MESPYFFVITFIVRHTKASCWGSACHWELLAAQCTTVKSANPSDEKAVLQERLTHLDNNEIYIFHNKLLKPIILSGRFKCKETYIVFDFQGTYMRGKIQIQDNNQYFSIINIYL